MLGSWWVCVIVTIVRITHVTKVFNTLTISCGYSTICFDDIYVARIRSKAHGLESRKKS